MTVYRIYRIEQQAGHFNALDNLESSGSKIIRNEPTACKLPVARKVEDTRSGRQNFMVFKGFFLGCRFTAFMND